MALLIPMFIRLDLYNGTTEHQSHRLIHITMGPGEVAEFDTRLPHWFGPAGDEPVEILSIHGSHGQRMHVRAAPRRKTQTA